MRKGGKEKMEGVKEKWRDKTNEGWKDVGDKLLTCGYSIALPLS